MKLTENKSDIRKCTHPDEKRSNDRIAGKEKIPCLLAGLNQAKCPTEEMHLNQKSTPMPMISGWKLLGMETQMKEVPNTP